MARFTRIARYMMEMFPPHVHGVAGLLKFFAPYFLLQLLVGHTELGLGPAAIPGAITMALFFLLFRVYDELKDVESDRRLAAAGDPRYMDRPIVTGAIKMSDIVAMRWVLTVVMIALNIGLGSIVFTAFSVVFFVMWLSYQWFFVPRIQDDLVLALVTHNPIVMLMLGYVVAVFYSDFGVLPPASMVVVMLFGLWLPATAWETARKIRIPEDETAYQTYSQKFGKAAPLVPMICAAISTLCLVGLWRTADAAGLYPVALGLAFLVMAAACIRFFVAPTREAAKLQPAAELFAVAVDGGLTLAIAGTLGFAFL